MSNILERRFRQEHITPFKKSHHKEIVGGHALFWTSKLNKIDSLTPDVNFQLVQRSRTNLLLEVAEPDKHPILTMDLLLNRDGDLIGLKKDEFTIRRPYQGHILNFYYKVDKDNTADDHIVDPRMATLSKVTRSYVISVSPLDGEEGLPVRFREKDMTNKVIQELGAQTKVNWVEAAIAYLSGEVNAETALNTVVPVNDAAPVAA